MKLFSLAALLALASATAAFAQGSPNQPAQNPSAKDQGTQTQAHQSIGQQVRDNLAQAGYTDIKIMPESFLVRAKDKSGNQIMMVINPDSITTITDINPRSTSGATTGSAPASGNPNGSGNSNNAPQPGSSPK